MVVTEEIWTPNISHGPVLTQVDIKTLEVVTKVDFLVVLVAHICLFLVMESKVRESAQEAILETATKATAGEIREAITATINLLE